jgi:DNA-binding SARP family transcriptional activator
VPTLALRLCGDVALTSSSGAPIDPPLGAKALGLLAFLAVEPGSHRREQVTALLWGDYPEEKAKASLRQALTHLRNVLGDELRIDRSTVEVAGLTCDVSEFVRLAPLDAARAIAIDIPRFLDGLSVRGSAAFNEWADDKRVELRGMYSKVMAKLAREAFARRAWRDARELAEKWSALDPLADEPMALVVETQFLSGDRDEALATYARHVARLASDAGRTPSKSLAELASRVQQARVDANGTRRSSGPTRDQTPSFAGSLVGRQREWDALTHAWAAVGSDASRAVLIEGEPGVGKSRLADDFLRWVASQGGVVLRGRGYDMRAGAPFGAVIEILHSALDVPELAGVDPQWLVEVGRVVPELRRRFPGLADATSTAATADGWRLFEAVAQVLIAVAEENPIAVLIDDLQWCDADSCGLLHFLVRRLAEARVLWCATFTLGEIERDAPSARLSRALRSGPSASSMTLTSLSEGDVRELIRELGRVDEQEAGRSLAAHIHEVTGGNPFYVIELLKTLFAQDLLGVDQDTGAWVVSPSALADRVWPVLAPTVQEAVADRIERLPDPLHAVLISIAAAGRGCRTDVLSHLHGISRLHAAMLGDTLVERHLVAEEDGVYRCAHPTIAHVVRARLTTSRRREVHRAHALALELLLPTRGREAGDVGEIARHAEQAGEVAMAYRYALLAGEAASARSAYDEALSWLDLAAASAASPEESDIVGRQTDRVLNVAGRVDARPVRALRSEVSLTPMTTATPR